MYVRHTERPIHVPENYSGNLFSPTVAPVPSSEKFPERPPRESPEERPRAGISATDGDHVRVSDFSGVSDLLDVSDVSDVSGLPERAPVLPHGISDLFGKNSPDDLLLLGLLLLLSGQRKQCRQDNGSGGECFRDDVNETMLLLLLLFLCG